MKICIDCQSPPRTPKAFRCKACQSQRDKELHILRTETAEAMGRCSRCRKNPATEGHPTCPTCRKQARGYERKRKPVKGNTRCSMCRQTGHNFASCQKNPDNAVT